jgi:Bacteriophage Mu Gp45 spike protein
MHRATPRNTSFRAFSAGGARALVDSVSDNPMMQEMAGSFMKGESRKEIEAPQNYGFSSVILPAKKGKDGQIEECAEAFMSFIGGNRSFPVAGIMDDRRHRPMGLKPGENAQYDDIGQMTLMRRAGLFLLSLDGPDESQQQGGAQGKAGDSGGQQKNVERMVSLRHVEKKKQERKKSGQGDSGGGGGGASAASAEQQAAQGGQQQQQDFKHEGESVNTEIRCTKGRIEFRSGDTVVGYYDKGKDAWYFKGKIVTMESDERIETIGPTFLGLEKTGQEAPKVSTIMGPAKKTNALV